MKECRIDVRQRREFYRKLLTQLSVTSEQKLRTHNQFAEADATGDLMTLWAIIKETHSTKVTGIAYKDVARQEQYFINISQQKGEQLAVFLKRFRQSFERLVDMESVLQVFDENQLLQKFISALEEPKFSEFKKYLRNQTLMTGSTEHLPKTLDLVVEAAARFQTAYASSAREPKELTIYAATEGVPVKPWHSTAKCHNCKKKGHIAPNCPHPRAGKDSKKVDKDRDADIDEAIEELKTEPKQTDGKKGGKTEKRAKSRLEDQPRTRFADL